MSPTTTIEVNGYAVRELRKRSGLSILDVAGTVGTTRAYITKIELGTSRRVSPKVFNGLLAALAIDDRRALLAHPHGQAAA